MLDWFMEELLTWWPFALSAAIYAGCFPSMHQKRAWRLMLVAGASVWLVAGAVAAMQWLHFTPHGDMAQHFVEERAYQIVLASGWFTVGLLAVLFVVAKTPLRNRSKAIVGALVTPFIPPTVSLTALLVSCAMGSCL